MTTTLLSSDARPNTTSRRRPAVPRVATSVLLSSSTVASLLPSLLPRSSLVQAVVTALFAATALVSSALLHRLTSRVRPTSPHVVARRAAAVVGLTAVIVAGSAAWRWQNGLRAAMGAPPVGPTYLMEVVCGAVSICAILVVAGVGFVRGIRRLGSLRTSAAVVALAGVGYIVAVPWAEDSFAHRYALADAAVDTALVIPSGDTDSLVGWDSLGREGRKFVAAGSDIGAIRTYVGLRSAPTLEERARLAVDQLDRAGGLRKAHIVIAVPTGSGWVDENAVGGIEERFGGDVATVALQYSNQPSWATFLFAEDAAIQSATALLDGVRAALASLPENERPDLHVYGQSLGAFAGSAAVERDSRSVCSTVWAGPPGGRAPAGGVVLANSSDPVVWWSSELLYAEPHLEQARVDAPVPQWVPMITYLQTTVDMLSALNAPAGHGHRYGTDQGTLLREC